jgi:hypothetical protein
MYILEEASNNVIKTFRLLLLRKDATTATTMQSLSHKIKTQGSRDNKCSTLTFVPTKLNNLGSTNFNCDITGGYPVGSLFKNTICIYFILLQLIISGTDVCCFTGHSTSYLDI